MGDKRDAYIKELKERMDEWNAEIDLLWAKAGQAKAEAKIEYLKKLEELRAKRKVLQERIAEAEQGSESAWEALKQGLESSWITLKMSLTKAKSEFESGYKGEKEDE